jgi:hypothetical protein
MNPLHIRPRVSGPLLRHGALAVVLCGAGWPLGAESGVLLSQRPAGDRDGMCVRGVAHAARASSRNRSCSSVSSGDSPASLMSSRSIERSTAKFTVAMSRSQNGREGINEITGPS